jgi:hypothetical protein
MDNDTRKEFEIRGEELVKRIKEIVHEGNVRRIIIKDQQGKPYMEIPLTVGVVGALFAPVLAAIGALAALAGVFKVEVIRREEEDKE